MDAIALNVAILAGLLGSPNWATREHGSHLAAQSHVTVVWCLTEHPDPEIKYRICKLVQTERDRWAWETATHLRAKQFSNRLPWLDGMRSIIGEEALTSYIQLARELTPPEGYVQAWEDYRVATHWYLRDQLLAGTSIATLQSQLNLAGEIEMAWINANQYNPVAVHLLRVGPAGKLTPPVEEAPPPEESEDP